MDIYLLFENQALVFKALDIFVNITLQSC